MAAYVSRCVSVGFPAGITTRLLGGNHIIEKGFFASEEVIPTNIYFEELAKRGIHIQANFIKKSC
ncbi:hypothetical protein GCM10007111_25530 [Virgibacillus kapii]|uniref:Saccharopine dehydrogenase-like C-terminal domain-containing protein n=1 Tax=Virgibacillus kapii TaxID=1638645 RepID=A0ABQ2DLY6_9BACI|nr:hypothetical protein M948_01955 [Virgibacillus sp. CM-4]GGJ62311.1 hypothetical protein GCM10007111_25530 [Virgibacillus kapii]